MRALLALPILLAVTHLPSGTCLAQTARYHPHRVIVKLTPESPVLPQLRAAVPSSWSALSVSRSKQPHSGGFLFAPYSHCRGEARATRTVRRRHRRIFSWNWRGTSRSRCPEQLSIAVASEYVEPDFVVWGWGARNARFPQARGLELGLPDDRLPSHWGFAQHHDPGGT